MGIYILCNWLWNPICNIQQPEAAGWSLFIQLFPSLIFKIHGQVRTHHHHPRQIHRSLNTRWRGKHGAWLALKWQYNHALDHRFILMWLLYCVLISYHFHIKRCIKVPCGEIFFKHFFWKEAPVSDFITPFFCLLTEDNL